MATRYRNPETGEVVELVNGQWVPVTDMATAEPTPKEPQGSAEPEAEPSNTFGDFISGLWGTTGKPMFEALPVIAKGAYEQLKPPPLTIDPEEFKAETEGRGLGPVLQEMGGGIAEAHKEQLLKALEADAPIGQRAFHLLTGLTPLIGPPLAEASDKMNEGETARGLGEMTGIALPIARPFERLNAAARLRSGLETGAGRNIARALGAGKDEVRGAISNAPEISRGIGIGGRETLRKRAAAASKKAYENLEEFKKNNPDIDVDLETPAKEVLSELPTYDLPSGGGRFARQANAAAGKTKTGTTYPELVKAQRKVVNSLRRDLKAFEKAGSPAGTAPSEAAYEMRTGLGLKADQGGYFKRNPLHPVSVEARAAGKLYDKVTRQMKKDVKGLAEVDAPAAAWHQAADLLENAARTDAVKVPAWEVYAGRMAIEGTPRIARLGLGAGTIAGGVATGGAPGMAMMAYGAWRIASDIISSPMFQSLSAAEKLTLARLIKEGSLAEATLVGSATGRALEKEQE